MPQREKDQQYMIDHLEEVNRLLANECNRLRNLLDANGIDPETGVSLGPAQKPSS